jgi:hypothetical protein
MEVMGKERGKKGEGEERREKEGEGEERRGRKEERERKGEERRKEREKRGEGEGEERSGRRKERMAKNKAVFILVRLQGCDVIDDCEMSVEVRLKLLGEEGLSSRKVLSQDSGHIST